MERHRHEKIGVGDELGSRGHQHLHEQPDGLVAIAIFETVNEVAHDTFEMRGGAGAGVNGGMAQSRGGERDFAGAIGQGMAEPFAERRPDEVDAPPAYRAQDAMCGKRCVAAQANGRKDEVGGVAQIGRHPGARGGQEAGARRICIRTDKRHLRTCLTGAADHYSGSRMVARP